MGLRDLALLYLIVGIGCAIAIYKTSGEEGPLAMAQAALAVPLWPLWAPIALTTKRQVPAEVSSKQTSETITRVKTALGEAVLASKGTALEGVLPAEAAERIIAEVERRVGRHDELEKLLQKDAFDLERAELRVAVLAKAGGSARALSTAKLDMENVRRLRALRDRDVLALDELCALAEALRTQVTLARYSGSSAADIGGIVTEVWARVEGLGAAIEATRDVDESLRVQVEETVET